MRLLILLLFTTVSIFCYSQDSIVKYFDKKQKEIQSVHTITHKGGGHDIYHGSFTEYYPNGKINKKGSYSLGQLHGNYQEFSESEKLMISCRYTNGILNGEYKTYYPSGNIKERKLYINGKIQGDYKYFPDAKNAKPTKIDKYQMGVKK